MSTERDTSSFLILYEGMKSEWNGYIIIGGSKVEDGSKVNKSEKKAKARNGWTNGLRVKFSLYLALFL